MTKAIRISLTDDALRVITPTNSPFMKGVHRIFISNVLGLNVDDNDTGYTIEKDKVILSDTINELARYFLEHKAKAEFDNNVQQIVDAFNNGEADIQEAKRIGARIKERPPKRLNVPGFIRPLKPYQIPLAAHLVGVRNVANFSVPGSGKTSVTLAGFSILRQQRVIDKILVICPRAAFMSWEEEFSLCFGTTPRSIRLSGPVSRRKKLYRKVSDAELVLMTYQMASQDVNKLIAMLSEFKVMLVLDESHYIKRMDGGKWASTVISIAPYAKRRCILSGTPVPNSLEDLWSQMTFLWPNPKILGSAEEYKDRIISKGSGAAEDIKEELFPLYCRVHKSQLKLKKPKYHRIKIRMRPYQQSIYNALAVKLLADVVKAPEERIKLRTWRRARMTRLLQTASNPALLARYSEEFDVPPLDAAGLSISELVEKYPKYEVPPKIVAVTELASKLLDKGLKVILWTSFIHNIRTLAKLLKKYEPRVVFGDVPNDSTEDESFNREKMIHEFKSSDRFNLLIANPGACAESVSLHKVCRHAIYLDRTFNCALYMQSLDRVHRIGLGHNEQVHYYIFESDGSVDEVIDMRLREKQERMLHLLDDDFAVLDLEASYHQISEESDEDADFTAMIKHLRDRFNRTKK